MTAHTPRALRVGVLLGDNLVEERVFRTGAPITFGQSLRCALSIPGDGIPAEHVLFAAGQLHLAPHMRGRLAHGETVQELAPGATVALARGARGRLQIGDATLLFQEIAAPPIVPRPTLPASMRPSLVDRVDRRLAAIVGLSLAAHLGIAIYAWATEADQSSMFAPSIAQTYRHDTIEVIIPDEPTLPAPTETVEPGPAAATPVAPVQQTGQPIVDRPRITTNRPTTTPTLGDDDITRFASIMSGNDRTETGTGGTMSDRKPGADLNAQIADARTREVRIGSDGETFREQPGPRLGTSDGPRIDAPTQVRPNEPKQIERQPGRIQVRPVPGQPPTTTTLTVQMVLDKINTVYMTGLVRCYSKGLVGDASLSGKVSVSFTVTERGSLEDQSARGITSDVDACIQTQMGSWRFPIPKDKDGDPDTASFALVLALQPS